MDHFIVYKTEHGRPKGFEYELIQDWRITFTGKNYKEYLTDSGKFFIVGDLVEGTKVLNGIADQDIPLQKGNFYIIKVEADQIKIFSNLFNVLPLYIFKSEEVYTSSIKLYSELFSSPFTVDKQFIIESLLFNYSFQNRTLYKEIKTVPANHFIRISTEDSFIEKVFDTNSLFTSSPKTGKKVASEISDLFITNTKSYFPDELSQVAFTSGFDGRTLVSTALYFDKKIETFSFGKDENADVFIPKKNAEELGIPYRSFDLGEHYIENDYTKEAQNYIQSTAGGNGFIYAHFLDSTKKIAKKSNYLLSGVVGSELFRALHITGAVTSSTLASVFSKQTKEEITETILNAEPLKVLDTSLFKKELDNLIEEVWLYKKSLPKNMTQNQQFYKYVFEEIFRKFFGQWIYLQMPFIKVRTPFLDFEFIKALLQTEFAGANNDFFTENPFKRRKGQFIYADIIKKTNQTIYKQKTGKGYRPKDVREWLQQFRILWPFIKKRIKKKIEQPNLDNLGIVSGFLKEKNQWGQLLNNQEWINKKYSLEQLQELSPYTPEKKRDTLLMTTALSYSISNTLKNNQNPSHTYEKTHSAD